MRSWLGSWGNMKAFRWPAGERVPAACSLSAGDSEKNRVGRWSVFLNQ
jgi:hypothetical protein